MQASGSEAILRTAMPGNDDWTHACVLAALCCPSFALGDTHLKERAQGRPDANRTRSLVCENKNTRGSRHRYAEAFRPSLRNGFTAYSALSLVTGLCCHHRPCDA